jgi:hypothetical protein
MAWRLAKSLATLRAQIDKRWPHRDRKSDGTIGDTRHQAKGTKSDHNPNKAGVVTAFDVTRDAKHGPDLKKLIPLLLKDKRTKYLIHDRHIYAPAIQGGKARPYTGKNAHKQHLHISVSSNPDMYDRTFPWLIEAPTVTKPTPPIAGQPEVAKPAVAVPVAFPGAIPEQKGYTPKEAIAYFMTLGWARVHAIALVANLMWESGGNTTKPPSIIWKAHGDKGKDGKHHSHGAGQWNDTPKVLRFQGLEKFAADRGTEWTDPTTQLAFLDHELHTSERKAGVKLRATETIEAAVTAAIGAWRPSIPHADRRLAIARTLL